MPARKRFQRIDPKSPRRPKSSNLSNQISRAARYRIDAGLTQNELSVAAGVNLQGIMKIERGEIQRMHLETIIRVALALNVAPSELIPALAYKPRRVLKVPSAYHNRVHPVTERKDDE